MIATIKKIPLILFLLGIPFGMVHADDTQELNAFYNSLLPDFQKMTPEASALGQYGKYGNAGYTGVPNISIPLFSVSSGSYSIPFELHYDASGIKVDQQATYVGLGWNLMVGGSISQIVCGQNDFHETTFSSNPGSISNSDLFQTIFPNSECPPYYFMAGYPSVAFPSVPAIPGTCQPIDSDRKKFDILRDVSNGSRIPDIFQASFCGHSVSFIIDTFNKVAKIIRNDATAYKIELKEYNAYPHSIEITDDHGLKYLFAEAPESSMENNASYRLSKIQNAAGQNLAEFKYSEVAYGLLQPYHETMGKNDENSGMPIASETIRKRFIERNYPHSLEFVIKEYYPDTIITDKETVTFTYGAREDIKGAKRIDKITVMSNSEKNKVLHTVDLKYGYFAESGSMNTLCARYGYTEVYNYKRLKLSDVTVDGKKHSFEYNETQDLPTRLTMRQDFWGYYNGQSNEDGLCASPKFKYNVQGKLEGQEAIGPANRFADENLCKIGTLTKIIYPTGGYTKFDYEIHHFDDVNEKIYYPSAKSKVEYVKTVICSTGYDGSGYNSTPNTKEFDIDQPVTVEIVSNTQYYPSSQQYYDFYMSIVGKYSSGNIVFSRYYNKYNDKENIKESFLLPKGHYVLSCQFKAVASGLITGGSIQISFPPEYEEDTSIADVSGKSIGGGVRIKTIKNYDSDNTLLGYTYYRYNNGKLLIPTVIKEHINMQYLFATAATTPSVYYIPPTFCCAFYFITSNPTYLAVCSLGCPNVGYSMVTKENYDKNGLLMSYTTEGYHNEGYVDANNNMFRVNMDELNGRITESMSYSRDSVLMHKAYYTYNIIGQHPSLNDIVFFPWARCLDMNPGSSALDVYYNYSLYPKYPIIVLPSSVTETSYVNGEAMATVMTTYGYKASNYQPTYVTKVAAPNSNASETSLTKFWYPEDSEVSSSNTACLTNVHCISERVKAVEYKNGNTVGGYRNVYNSLSNGLPVVSKNYSIVPSGSAILELEVTDNDAYGNICGYKKKDGTPVAIIWSYNHQLPVLEIVGKTYSEIKAMSSDVAKLEKGTKASEIRNATESLHSALMNGRIMATAYEYSPWHTVSCIIKPNGYRTRYEYDNFGRLKEARDADDKTLQKYLYNYKKN
jgi:YD repeat-containing protein